METSSDFEFSSTDSNDSCDQVFCSTPKSEVNCLLPKSPEYTPKQKILEDSSICFTTPKSRSLAKTSRNKLFFKVRPRVLYIEPEEKKSSENCVRDVIIDRKNMRKRMLKQKFREKREQRKNFDSNRKEIEEQLFGESFSLNESYRDYVNRSLSNSFLDNFKNVI